MSRIKKLVNFLMLKKRIKKLKKCEIKSINISPDIEIGDYCNITRKVNIGENCKIGKATYVGSGTTIESNTCIGKFCSISRNVFIGPGEHYKEFVTTHPILFSEAWRRKFSYPEKCEYKKNIGKQNLVTNIGNDVWIGVNVIIMRGVNIGDGAIIGAGAIVTKDVKPYSIVAGIPANEIGFRFKKEEIEKLKNEKNKWWNLKDEEIQSRLMEMYKIEEYINKYC